MMTLKELFRTKSIQDMEEPPSGKSLRRCLHAFDLVLLGIGAIIGAGVFVLTGVVAATKAGPAVVISYLLAGFASALAALAYAELAANIGGCGSAYTYAYVGFGELIAWIIGWDLLLEYGMSVSTVAIGWSGYVINGLQAVGLGLPNAIAHNPFAGGIINLPAVLIILILTALLSIGVKQSARFNSIIVLVKLAVICLFVVVAAFYVQVKNWQPFAPFGWDGIVRGAALVFFAYIGFDAVSTTAEEAVKPARDLPIGILFSVVICGFVYLIVAGLVTGIVPYTELNVASPIAHALLVIGHNVAAGFIALGAIAGLTSVMLVMYYGLTRVFLAMSRDHLLPPVFSRIHPTTLTPVTVIIYSGIVMAIIAGLTPINEAVELVNIGTLLAFILVCAGVIVLRWKRPELTTKFRLPFYPILPLLGIIFCLYLMFHLPLVTWGRFAIWLLIGIAIYFFYSRNRSLLQR